MNNENEQIYNIPKLLPILPLKDVVVFPHILVPIVVTMERNIKLVDDVLHKEKMIGIVSQKIETEHPKEGDIYKFGTAGEIMKMLRFPDQTMRALIRGIARIKIKEIVQEEPYIVSRIELVEEPKRRDKKTEALMRNAVSLFQRMVKLAPYLPEELATVVMNFEDPSQMADFIASNLNFDIRDKQALLEDIDPSQRLEKVNALLTKEVEILQLGEKIRSRVKSEVDKTQREYILREQLKAIQEELGIKDEKSAEIEELSKKIKEVKMPEMAQKAARKELDRLKVIPPQAAEYSVIRTYLDWLIELPWAINTEDNLDIKRARRILSADHYDLEDVKERIIEYLAVRKLKNDTKGPIICFVGPPGVGKTSLGRSIAHAVGRKFVHMSLGGIRDEAEIRGHRRTYVGALPGRIIQLIKNAGSNNPVFMLDEIDKVGVDFRGDPASALLEVLDPEQNNEFVDHYLDVPFDLSRIMFITTANITETIPPALMDRMELIRLPGYTLEEKMHIAKRYLIPRQIQENGLKKGMVQFTDDAVKKIIGQYTIEAGVRNLERNIGSVTRKIARTVAEGKKGKFKVDVKEVENYLGVPRVIHDVRAKEPAIGVTTGLAWTPYGGEILFIESTKMKGRKSLLLTGSLGDVMQESAQAALSYVRANAKKFGIKEGFFDKYDIHIHVPEGATPKDGPSAGLAIAVSLISLMKEVAVKPDIAMTGEITLQGKVLPIGGVKEKVLGAKRAGINTVIVPEDNKKDIKELTPSIRKGMKFIYTDRIDKILKYVLVEKRK